MAIQNRRGNFVDFDPYKMLAGEFAYSLDTEELYYCVSPGIVKRCATKEDVIEILETSQEAYDGLQQLLTELENETVLTGMLADISQLLNDVAINKANIGDLVNYVGDLTTLTTVEKSSIVGALNEIDTNHKSHLAETVSKVILITEPFGQLTKTTVDLGFKPKMVNINACIRNTTYESEGYVDALNSSVKFNIIRNNDKDIQGVYAVMFMKSSQDYIAGVATITDTGIEINWQSLGEITDATGNRRLIITATTHGEG